MPYAIAPGIPLSLATARLPSLRSVRSLKRDMTFVVIPSQKLRDAPQVMRVLTPRNPSFRSSLPRDSVAAVHARASRRSATVRRPASRYGCPRSSGLASLNASSARSSLTPVLVLRTAGGYCGPRFAAVLVRSLRLRYHSTTTNKELPLRTRLRCFRLRVNPTRFARGSLRIVSRCGAPSASLQDAAGRLTRPRLTLTGHSVGLPPSFVNGLPECGLRPLFFSVSVSTRSACRPRSWNLDVELRCLSKTSASCGRREHSVSSSSYHQPSRKGLNMLNIQHYTVSKAEFDADDCLLLLTAEERNAAIAQAQLERIAFRHQLSPAAVSELQKLVSETISGTASLYR